MATQEKIRVLVVDDNKDSADSLDVLLRWWGYDCRIAYDGVAGLEAARVYLPHCLILDINMPGMDGCRLAEEIRKQPGLEHSRLVALTAYSDARNTQRINKAGFEYHLVKPVDLTELERILRMLEEITRLASRTQELARQNVALAGETKELLKEVKEDIREVREEVRGLKEEIRGNRETSSEDRREDGRDD